MRVLMDGYWWVDGPPSGRLVLRELTAAWIRSFPEDELFVVVPSGRISHELREQCPDVNFVDSRLRFHPLINTFEIPRIANAIGGIDAMICQNFAAPGDNSAVFIHDVIFQSSPEWFTVAERIYLSFIPRTACRASVVLTSSASEASRIRRYNPRLLSVVPTGLGVATELSEATPVKPQLGIEPLNFLLSVGRLNIRKNLAMTIRGALKAQVIGPQCPLVVVGEAAGKAVETMKDLSDVIEDGTVIFTGFLSNSELRWLYENCKLFAYLSLDEGFGLPPVEARAFGAPLIVSDLDVFRETLGSSAVFVNPLSIADVVAGFELALPPVSVQQRLVQAENLSSNDWKCAVTRIRKCFSSVASGGNV